MPDAAEIQMHPLTFLTVIGGPRSMGGGTKVQVRCVCGVEKWIYKSTTRKVRSCGCLHDRLTGEAGTSHGLSHTAEYRAWLTMKRRCLDPRNRQYPSYGGRGITVCESWLQSVSRFVSDMGPRPSRLHQIDRRDNDKGYSPDNCRWVIPKVNCRNRRDNRVLVLDGQARPLAEWAELSGLKGDTIGARLDAGWPVEQAIRTPLTNRWERTAKSRSSNSVI